MDEYGTVQNDNHILLLHTTYAYVNIYTYMYMSTYMMAKAEYISVGN